MESRLHSNSKLRECSEIIDSFLLNVSTSDRPCNAILLHLICPHDHEIGVGGQCRLEMVALCRLDVVFYTKFGSMLNYFLPCTIFSSSFFFSDAFRNLHLQYCQCFERL